MKCRLDIKGFVQAKRVANGCLEWGGRLDRDGYGTFDVGNRRVPPRRRFRAHCFAWVEAHGRIPNGLHVLHKCDNRKCVEVLHLFLGTNLDNVRDAAAKGRIAGFRKGERANASKLTDAQRREIRTRRAAGQTLTSLGVRFGVTYQCIRYVCGHG